MIDTLKIAEGLQDGAGGFPPEQARKLARVIGEASDDKRLRDLDIKMGVHNVLAGLMMAVLLAMVWQLLTLRGEVSTVAERLVGMQRIMDERFLAVQKHLDQRFDSFEGTLDRRLTSIEQKVQRP